VCHGSPTISNKADSIGGVATELISPNTEMVAHSRKTRSKGRFLRHAAKVFSQGAVRTPYCAARRAVQVLYMASQLFELQRKAIAGAAVIVVSKHARTKIFLI
jgi:hypothetical protein